MTIRIPSLIPTPLERAAGRFMRAPDHEEALDNGGDDDDDDDQSGDADLDADSDGGNADDDDQGGSSDDEGDGQRKPRQSGWERRVGKLTARNKELEQRLQALEGKNRDESGGKPEKEAKSGKPQLADYNSYEDFIEAIADWKADEKINSSREQSERQTQDKAFNKRFNEGRKSFKDWDSVVTDDVSISKAMQTAIKDSDIPADIIYYLGQNPDEADAILELSEQRQIKAIGRIEDKLEASKSKGGGDKGRERRQSAAPAPLKTNTSTKGGNRKTYEEMSFAEFAAARASEERGKR